MKPPNIGTGRLYAKDIAAQFHISIRSARRWLKELEKSQGSTVVGRVGCGGSRAQRYTTRAALARVQPVGGPTTLEMHDRISCIEDEVRQLREFVSDLIRRVAHLER